MADHFQRAGDQRAADWLVRAGERAHRAYAWPMAEARYLAALALLAGQRGQKGQRGWLLVRLSVLHEFTDLQRAIADLDEAIRLADTAGEHALAAWALFRRGLLRCVAGDARRGLAEMTAGGATLDALTAEEQIPSEALVFARRTGSDWRDLVASFRIAAGHYRAVQAGEENHRAAAGSPLTPAGGGDAAEAQERFEGQALLHAVLGRPAMSVAAYARYQAECMARGLHLDVGLGALNELRYVALPYLPTDLPYRKRLADEAETAFAKAREHNPRLPPRQGRLPLLLLEGNWDETQAVALAVLEGGAHTAHLALARSILGPLARAQGDTTLAWAQVRALLPAGPATAPGDRLEFRDQLDVQRLAVHLACDAGDLPTTRAWLAAHDRWLAWSGSVLGRAEAALSWAAYCRAAGDLTAARDHVGRALTHATEPRQPLALLAAHRLLGELATALGQQATAQEHLDQALALADACAAPYERAPTLLAQAELAGATGEQTRATATLYEARALLLPLAARPALARADALAARLVAVAPTRPASLSAREVEVLRLVTQGLTNTQIAARLFLSPHTVDQHLRSIYGKLEVSSRAAATAFAVEHGLR